jgi:hypothetical protein
VTWSLNPSWSPEGATMVSMETSHGLHRIIVQIYSYDCRETIPILLYDFTIMCIYIYVYV